jgi:hypothetical protein
MSRAETRRRRGGEIKKKLVSLRDPENREDL